MFSSLRKWGCVVLLAGMPCLLGCPRSETEVTDSPAPAANGGGHDHAKDFAGAVAELEECRDQIRAAFAAGTPTESDGPMHRALDLVGHLSDFAKKENMTDEQLQTVAESAKTMNESFGKIHQGFHGGEPGASYDEVSEKLDEALAALSALTGA